MNKGILVETGIRSAIVDFCMSKRLCQLAPDFHTPLGTAINTAFCVGQGTIDGVEGNLRKPYYM